MSHQHQTPTPVPHGWAPPPPPPRRFSWTRWALWTTAAAALAFAGFGALGHLLRDDSNPSANPAACKSAMQRDFDRALAAGSSATPSDRPAECDGIDDATVQRYAADIANKQFGDIEP